MQRRRLFWIFAVGLVGGCAYPDDSDCDPDQVYEAGYCVYPEPDACAGDAALTAPGGYGDPCVDDTECSAPADFCVKSPFDDVGYCSSADCEVGGDECPECFSCVDIGIASVPPYCSR
jgi:hypothetical protein